MLFLSRTPLDRGRVLNADRDLVSGRIERSAVVQDAPGRSCKFISKRDRKFVAMHAGLSSDEPFTKTETVNG